MPDVAAFPGVRYDPARVDPAAVTSPPYDVISPAERIALEAASPYNVVRLDLGPLGEEEQKYSRARSLFDGWVSGGVLARDEEPSLYLYEQRFLLDGAERRQTGVLAAVEISEEILPHERTMTAVVEDRLAVIRAVEANLSPVFCLYWSAEPAGAAALDATLRTVPYANFASPDGARHRAWQTADPAVIEAFAKTLAQARVMIADGHHRYRTAEAYRDERRTAAGAGPWDRTLVHLVDAGRHPPALLPIHRLVKGLSLEDAIERLRGAFDVEPATTTDPDALAALVAERRGSGRVYGLLAAGGAALATLTDDAAARAATAGEHSEPWRDLDVAVLHALVFDRLLGSPEVTYVHHPNEAAEALAAGDASLAVLLAPTPVDAVRAVAEAHDSMPPKSTFFVPKPRTGLVIRTLR